MDEYIYKIEHKTQTLCLIMFLCKAQAKLLYGDRIQNSGYLLRVIKWNSA